MRTVARSARGRYLARHAFDAATEALDRLTALAAGCGDGRRSAVAELAPERPRAAEGDARARSHLQATVEAFSELDPPLEAARAQVELARHSPPEARAAAVAETRVALATFERLGTSRDADAAATCFERSVRRMRAWPKRYGTLTKREREVIALVADGCSDADSRAAAPEDGKPKACESPHRRARLGLTPARRISYCGATPLYPAGVYD